MKEKFELLEYSYPKSFLAMIDENKINNIYPIIFLGNYSEWTEDWSEIIKEQYPTRNLVPFAKDDRSDDVFCFDGDDTSGDPKVHIVHTFASPGWEDRGYLNNFKEWLKFAQEVKEEYEEDMREDET